MAEQRFSFELVRTLKVAMHWFGVGVWILICGYMNYAGLAKFTAVLLAAVGSLLIGLYARAYENRIFPNESVRAAGARFLALLAGCGHWLISYMLHPKAFRNVVRRPRDVVITSLIAIFIVLISSIPQKRKSDF